MIHLNNRNLRALGYQQITNLAAAVGFTLPEGTAQAVVVASGQAVRFRDDGTAPTSTIGFPLAVGTIYTMTQQQLSQVRFIESAASAALDICYYG